MVGKLSSYMIAYPDRFNFTEQDRRECFGTIDDMLGLVQRVRNVSRASLEEDAYQTDIFFLKKALFLFIDDVNQEISQERLEAYIVFGAYKGKELLQKLIILDCISAIQKSENPSVIEERLKALLGEKLAAEYERSKNSTRSQKKSAPDTPAAEIIDVLDEFFMSRKKVDTAPVNPHRILSQGEIDSLLKKMLPDF